MLTRKQSPQIGSNRYIHTLTRHRIPCWKQKTEHSFTAIHIRDIILLRPSGFLLLTIYVFTLRRNKTRIDMSVTPKLRAVTTYRLKEMKLAGEKIAMLTAYDYTMARIMDRSGIDVILVGDSAANVVAGYETTVPMTLDSMIYHGRSVARGVERALVVVDLPFGTYQGDSSWLFSRRYAS